MAGIGRKARMLAGLALASVTVASGTAGAMASSAAPAAWTATRLPTPAGSKANGSGYAGPVACPAVDSCVVLGQTQTPTGKNVDLIATEDAQGWASVVAPLPPGGTQAANLGPYVLACPAVGDCVGTSVYATATTMAADIIQESGGRWSATALPLPPNAMTGGADFPQVNAVRCPGIGYCVIVGDYTTTSGLTEAFVVSQRSTGFVASEAPTPGGVFANHGANLSSVSCYSRGVCVAVGSYVSPAISHEPLLVAVRTSILASAQPSLPSNAAADPEADLGSVSCGSTTTCVAAGEYQDSRGDRFGVIESAVSGHWTERPEPAPAGASTTAPSPMVHVLRCIGTSCVAVGQYAIAGGRLRGMALLDRSGSWSATELPTDASPPNPTVLSCSAAMVCAAAGSYVDSAGDIEGYLLSVSGTSLSWAQSPLPAGASRQPVVGFESIACPASTACRATGSYTLAGSGAVQMPLLVAQ